MKKIWCKLFGHKRPWLISPDGMRYVCSRCGYATDSVKAVQILLEGKLISELLRENLEILRFNQFQELIFE